MRITGCSQQGQTAQMLFQHRGSPPLPPRPSTSFVSSTMQTNFFDAISTICKTNISKLTATSSHSCVLQELWCAQLWMTAAAERTDLFPEQGAAATLHHVEVRVHLHHHSCGDIILTKPA